ncbi:MAG: isochorismatase family protein [Deltaproteobacteria bacterium]|nr:isochorismatase family protein [Deltaproteobacteria bacterium]
MLRNDSVCSTDAHDPPWLEMRQPNLKLRGEAALVVIDVQDRLAPVMDPSLFESMIANLKRLGAARTALDLPVVMTEQYPKGLGPTLPAVVEAFPDVERLDKVTFSLAGTPRIETALSALGRPKLIVAGMEAHVCVYQTVRDLAERYELHVLKDALAARTRENFDVGLRLIERAGGVITSTETVLFDLLGQAGTEAFKLVSRLVR